MYVRVDKPDGSLWYMKHIPDDPIERFHYEASVEMASTSFDCWMFWGKAPHPNFRYNIAKEIRDERYPDIPDSELDKYKP